MCGPACSLYCTHLRFCATRNRGVRARGRASEFTVRDARAKYTWPHGSDPGSRNVQIRSSTYSQAANGSPKRPPMPPRTVLGLGYTGWCLACPEAVVASTGGRSRTPRGGSRRARRTAIPLCNEPSSLSRHDGSHKAPHLKPCGRRGQHVAGMLSPAGCSQRIRTAVVVRCRARALWGMSCGGEARRSANEGGPLSRATVDVSGGYSEQQARG